MLINRLRQPRDNHGGPVLKNHPKWPLLYIGVTAAVFSMQTVPRVAYAQLTGPVSVPWDLNGTWYTGLREIPFISIAPQYLANVAQTIYVDVDVQSDANNNLFQAAACDQSWSGSSLVCNVFSTYSGTGYQDFQLAGFSTLGENGAGLSYWDYYYVNVFDVNTFGILGAGFD
jgi:hypothetical protein